MSSKENKTRVYKKDLAHEDEFVMEIRDAPPAHMLVEIKGLSKFLKHGVTKHQSNVFVAGDDDWTLTICAISDGRGCENEAVDRVYVYLSVSDGYALTDGCTVTADCNILLHNQISDNYLCFQGKSRRFDEYNSKWGFSISKGMLKEPFVVDDKCVFGAEVFLRKSCTSEALSLLDWKISNFSKLQGPWSSEEFTVGGLRWKMELYPKGCGGADGKSISISLACADHKRFAVHENVNVECCIRLRNKVSSAHRTKRKLHWFDDCVFLETQITVRDVVFNPK